MYNYTRSHKFTYVCFCNHVSIFLLHTNSRLSEIQNALKTSLQRGKRSLLMKLQFLMWLM